MVLKNDKAKRKSVTSMINLQVLKIHGICFKTALQIKFHRGHVSPLERGQFSFCFIGRNNPLTVLKQIITIKNCSNLKNEIVITV